MLPSSIALVRPSPFAVRTSNLRQTQIHSDLCVLCASVVDPLRALVLRRTTKMGSIVWIEGIDELPCNWSIRERTLNFPTLAKS